MQYLLSEEEYKRLIEIKREFDSNFKNRLLKLCVLASHYIPVNNAEPWHCPIKFDMEGNPLNDGVDDVLLCDDCPCDDVCPYPRKDYSD